MTSAQFKISFAHERQMRQFMKLLRVMQYLGSIGHSTSLNVGVDGDGAFSMDVELLKEGIPPVNLREVVELDPDIYEKAVKDFKKWCPESKDELAFGFE